MFFIWRIFPPLAFWREAMIKTGATKVGLPKPGFQERSRPSLASSSSSTTSTTTTALKASRSSNMLPYEHRLSRVGCDDHQCQYCYHEWTIFIAINGRCICSWKEQTVMTPWQNQQQELLPLAPVWRRLWQLEPSLILLRPALAAPLVRDDLS